MKTTYILVLTAVVFAAGLLFGLQFNNSTDKELESASTADMTQEVNPAPASQAQYMAAVPDVDTAEMERLHRRIKDLEQQLSARDQMLKLAQQSVQPSMPSEVAEPGQQSGTTETRISLEQASSFLPEPFASLMAKQEGQAIDYLNQHQVEDIDSEWAYQMEQKIADHFATHEYSNQVNLSSVSCKTSICEIRGYEYEADRFIAVYNAMQTQSWWRYSSSYAFQDSIEQSRYFYLLAELKR